MAARIVMKIAFAFTVLLLMTVLLVGSHPVHAQTPAMVTCNGTSFVSDVTIGRIQYSMTAQQACALNTHNGQNFTGILETANDIQATAKENVALALEAFKWRDPVIYNTVMQQYGLTVAPKQ